MVDFPSKERYDLNDFRRLVTVLRGENGCPWDREQTHESLRQNMLEEAYEVCGAIDEKDPIHLREELGDVLLQVLFHADLSAENGGFDLEDIADAECKKLIYRHPHVFGDVEADNSEQVLKNWDLLKEKEKEQRSLGQVMAGVTPALPGLWRAQKIQGKTAKAGAPFSNHGEAALRQVQALSAALTEEADKETLAELLFAVTELCRQRGVDAEPALHEQCEKVVAAQLEREKPAGS